VWAPPEPEQTFDRRSNLTDNRRSDIAAQQPYDKALERPLVASPLPAPLRHGGGATRIGAGNLQRSFVQADRENLFQ
jgi:hypothetical protein